MSNKRIRELRNLSKDELLAKERELETALFQARIRHAQGQLEKVSILWKTRKDLARVKMLAGQLR